MADLGETTLIDLPEFFAAEGIVTGELPNTHPSVEILDIESTVELMDPTGYFIAGTISFYTGPPVPREGQVWPRGNITNDK